mmetsp:Transcript_28507/g.52465  ORF Transcript_28507/g.52465 Transcript_28507/m.52465 type:complete len:89 (+) Transcript_28507:114-380(+)
MQEGLALSLDLDLDLGLDLSLDLNLSPSLFPSAPPPHSISLASHQLPLPPSSSRARKSQPRSILLLSTPSISSPSSPSSPSSRSLSLP